MGSNLRLCPRATTKGVPTQPKAPGTVPVFLEHPDDLKTEEAQDAIANSMADAFVEAVNAERIRQGRPPLSPSRSRR